MLDVWVFYGAFLQKIKFIDFYVVLADIYEVLINVSNEMLNQNYFLIFWDIK